MCATMLFTGDRGGVCIPGCFARYDSEVIRIMKKTLKNTALILAAAVLSLCIFAFVGCGKNEAVKAAEDAINKIGDVDLNSADAIQTAKEAFAKLNSDEKEQVGNYKKLTKAEEEYNTVKSVNDDIAAIVKASTVSFSDESFKVSENLSKISDIKERYKDLKNTSRKQ